METNQPTKPTAINVSPMYKSVLYIIPILSYFIPSVKRVYIIAPRPKANIIESPVGLSTNIILNNSIIVPLVYKLSWDQCTLYISLILCPKNTYTSCRCFPTFCNPSLFMLPIRNITLLYFFAYHDTTKSVCSISLSLFICMPFVIGDNIILSPISQ